MLRSVAGDAQQQDRRDAGQEEEAARGAPGGLLEERSDEERGDQHDGGDAECAAAAIVGDNLGYVIGRTGGRRLLERPGFLEHHRRQIIEKGEPFFEQHGPKAVFLGRWVAGLRIAAAWLAGINRMPWPVFLFWNALGGIAWATSVGLLAYALGPTVERVFKYVGFAGVGVVVLAIGGYLLWRRHHERREATKAP